MHSDGTLVQGQITISYSKGQYSSGQTFADTLAEQYATRNLSQNNNVHLKNTHLSTSRSSITEDGHTSYENLRLSQQALAQHDLVQTSAAANRRTQYSNHHIHQPTTCRPYVVGERVYPRDKHRAVHRAHRRSSISGEHSINHPYPMKISEEDIIDPEKQVYFSQERPLMRGIQAKDHLSVIGDVYGAGAQFEFSNPLEVIMY